MRIIDRYNWKFLKCFLIYWDFQIKLNEILKIIYYDKSLREDRKTCENKKIIQEICFYEIKQGLKESIKWKYV